MAENTRANLRKLIQASITYQNLPEESQAIFMERLLDLSEEDQLQVIEILQNEQQDVDAIEQEAAEKMQNLANEYLPKLKEMEQRFEKEVRQELETEEKGKEEAEIEQLMDDLNDE